LGGMAKAGRAGIGKRIAPPRFLAFAAAAIVSVAALTPLLSDWRSGIMAGFDVAAILFLASCRPLLDDGAAQIARDAERNDANRPMLLALTFAVTLVILVSVASVLSQRDAPTPAMLALVMATLVLAWTFSNAIFTLHYAHIFYGAGKDGAGKSGIHFPGTSEPGYWDFVYFAFCLGMTFQTSDTEVRTTGLRRVVTFHSLAAFVFNLGVLAFTINVLGS
jgi:uncharacterized membrane protein